MTHAADYFREVSKIATEIDLSVIEKMVFHIKKTRQENGRLFILGIGGGAANAAHAVNDFRKLCGIEAYAPTDNVSELTARVNDDGWDSVFVEWLKISKISSRDSLMILSVGGGQTSPSVSGNLIAAIDLACECRAKVLGIVGKASGHTAKKGDAVLVVPIDNQSHLTPHTEAFQSVIWHCLVSHPELQIEKTKW